jgi:mannan endo-1,4-beta-mannosidase
VRRSPFAALALVAALLAGCSVVTGHGSGSGGGGSQPSASAGAVPYDVRPLLKPPHKYLGAAFADAPKSTSSIDAFGTMVGKRPNLVEFYSQWGGGYDADGIRRLWKAGSLPMMAWEPFGTTLAAIGDGKSDKYIRKFATSVRDVNVPVVISFGHEMNTYWYPWGTRGNKPADFVRAWKRIHQIFADVGATSVIWVWSPNVINPVHTVKLQPYYPGDAYVDWIGMIGYYTLGGAHTFPKLYGPTMRQVRTFTDKPFFIAETASQPGPRRPADIADLLRGVRQHADVVGFVWFHLKKRADWRITGDAPSIAAFKRGVHSSAIGFPIEH